MDDYIYHRHLDLGRFVVQKRRVYLDLCAWIALRDVELGTRPDPASRKLLAQLRCAVAVGRIVCPISAATFLEVTKQTDNHTRQTTIRLIDELSAGVALLPHDDRVKVELRQLILAGEGIRTPLEGHVWSKVAYVLGVDLPCTSVFPPDAQAAIQKQFFDHMWTMSLDKLTSRASMQPPPDPRSFVDGLNARVSAFAGSFKTFDELYLTEVSGCISDSASTMVDMLEQRARTMGRRQAASEPEKASFEDMTCKLLLGLAIEKKLAHLVPTLHLDALCFAAVRWDRQRRLRANDLYDFRHAAAAIAYCHLLVTEKPLAHMLMQGHLGIRRDFSCDITSSLDTAADWVTGEASRPAC